MKTKHGRFLRDVTAACGEGCRFADSHKTLRAAWNACRNAEWMYWLVKEWTLCKGMRVPHFYNHEWWSGWNEWIEWYKSFGIINKLALTSDQLCDVIRFTVPFSALKLPVR